MKSYSLTNIFDNGSLTALYLPRMDIREPLIRQLIEGCRERVEAVRTG